MTFSAAVHSRLTSSAALAFGETPTDRDGIELHLRVVLEYLSQALHSDGLSTATCIDSGAKLVPERGRLAGKKVVDEADDFYPGLGTFRTAIHEVPVRIGVSILTPVRVLPTRSPDSYDAGIAAILGTDLFTHYPIATFDYSAARVLLTHRASDIQRSTESRGRGFSGSQPRLPGVANR